MSLAIRKGDKVLVVTGKNKGKSGKVMEIFAAKQRALVEGVNLVKKHMRRRSESEPGGIKEIPSSIHLSNIMVVCPHCNRQVRLGAKKEGKNKIRICRKCQQPV